MHGPAAKLTLLFGTLGVAWASPSLAGNRCESLEVEADDTLTAEWPDVVERIRAAFDGRDDVDLCARITLAADHDRIALRVGLPDGRSASRSVSERGDLLPTLEALLVVPEVRPVTAREEPPSPPPAPPLTTLLPADRVTEPARDAPAPSTAGRYLRIELSLLAGGRVGDGQLGAGLGAVSLVDVNGWLGGIVARSDVYSDMNRGTPPWGAVELGGVGGRRFGLGSASLDVTAGLAVAVQGTTTSVTQSAPDGPRITRTSSNTVPRGLVGSRLTFGARSTLRTFLALDGTVGRARDSEPDLAGDVSPFPVWTAGLSLGFTVGTL